jgi:hypothetical protein
MLTKESLGYLSILLALLSYIPYALSTLRKRTKPHTFSWIIWGLLTAIDFCAQADKHAGPGAWAMGFSSFDCFTIAVFALLQRDTSITRSDWISFTGALVAIPLWYFTHDPLLAVILVTLIDLLGFYPTLRKSYLKPHDELAFMYSLSALKFIVALLASQDYSLTTVLYPSYLILANVVFVVMLYWRRNCR